MKFLSNIGAYKFPYDCIFSYLLTDFRHSTSPFLFRKFSARAVDRPLHLIIDKSSEAPMFQFRFPAALLRFKYAPHFEPLLQLPPTSRTQKQTGTSAAADRWQGLTPPHPQQGVLRKARHRCARPDSQRQRGGASTLHKSSHWSNSRQPAERL